MGGRNPTDLRRIWISGAAWALATALVYAWFGQGVFFKTDGPFLVARLASGDIGHPYNALYMPLLWAWSAVLAPLGLTPYQVAVCFSALGTALGVGFVHVAFRRLGMPRAEAWLATALIAACPPVWFFATVVEHHGPFFAFAGLALWVTVRFAQAPSVALAVLLGVVTHLAYAVHATGNLLPGLLLPLFLAWRRAAGWSKRDLLLAVVAGIVHLALYWLLLPFEVTATEGGGVLLALEQGIGRPRHVRYLAAVSWQEWWWPYLPLSFTWLAALLTPRLRLEVLATAIGLVPYLALCLLLIVGEDEFGAYLLPLAIPAARLTVLAVPRPATVLALLASVALSVVAVTAHDDDRADRKWASGLRRAMEQPSRLMVGGPTDVARCLIHLPDVDFDFAVDLAQQFRDLSERDALAQLDVMVRIAKDTGQRWLWTAGAIESLADDDLAHGAAVRAHLLGLEPEVVAIDAFRGRRF